MNPREIIRRVQRLEIRTRRLVNESLAGSYHSVFRGRGMEFAEVREYQPGRGAALNPQRSSAMTGAWSDAVRPSFFLR